MFKDPIFVVLVIVFIGMIWMTTRQRKTQREAQSFIETLTPGTRVMTMAGYVGYVVETDEQYVTLESVPGSGAHTLWMKAAIRKPIVPVGGEEAAGLDSDVEIPDDVAKLIGEDSSDIDKLTRPDTEPDDNGEKK
ncbi:hypothetical protein GCM10010401_20150 [Rarobacter faecitabidus]|uniref:Preprotein translocase subunit YajC n=2 Tax=Rarobacter faecitabidus TaxID=13243 RepID=A0A542ZVL9_RARFA|nr:preprotein translocase subunit YajC [Rarobacter faecitabidus]